VIGEALELGRLWREARLAPDALRRLQERKLRALCHHAYARVPYYRRLFDSAGIHPSEIHTLDDLPRLPITTKAALRTAGLEETTARKTDPAELVTVSTSGSSGNPFTLRYSRREGRRRALLEFRALVAVGFRPRDRLAVLGPWRAHRLRWHQRLGLFRSDNISLLEPMEAQIARLRRLRPTILWAYPTALRALLYALDERLESVARPRLLITSAEVFDDLLRAQLERSLGLELCNFYGAMEVGRIAWECRAHRGLHVNADHVLLEAVRDGAPCPPGVPGSAVVTCLHAFAMPFIRYELGDVCTLADTRCPCGSAFPLIRAPGGRLNEIIRLPNGRLRPQFGVHYILRSSYPRIAQFRLVQERPDAFVLQVVTRDPLDSGDLEAPRRQLLEYLGEDVALRIERMDFIAGAELKFRSFVSQVAG